MNTKYTIILIGLFVLPLVGYCQEKTVDTVIQKKHYLELRYNDSLNNVSYEINWPGCMWGSWGLYRGQSKIAPLISVCLPYNDYLEYEWTGSGEDDIIVHSYRFPNDQFFIIYLDKDSVDSNLFMIDSIPSEEEFSEFVNSYAAITPLFEPHHFSPPKVLNTFWKTDSLFVPHRITRIIKNGYSLIVLYNVTQQDIGLFLEAAKSIKIYEITLVR